MFMIAASTALAAMGVVGLCIAVVVDAEGRVRGERVKDSWSLEKRLREGTTEMCISIWGRLRGSMANPDENEEGV